MGASKLVCEALLSMECRMPAEEDRSLRQLNKEGSFHRSELMELMIDVPPPPRGVSKEKSDRLFQEGEKSEGWCERENSGISSSLESVS